ncbi:MAG TPA: DUF3108 domain-containing protein [Terrimicrobiaceae bacterium]
MNRAVAVALITAIVCSLCQAAEPWIERVGPQTPGPFPLVRPFSGEFRFGWSNIGAASARAQISYSGDQIIVEVEGGTDGLARLLWQLDARHKAIILQEGLTPLAFEQVEKYAKRKVRTEAVFKPDGLWRIRAVTPDPKNVAKWKKIKIEPVRDIVSTMLLIRSQPLNNGDKIGVVAFPGDAPFLVEVTVGAHQQIRVANVLRKSIRLDFQIQRIDLKNKHRLGPHGKFKNGTVWISDDENRVPLRAEVNIFIGFVYGELANIKFN